MSRIDEAMRRAAGADTGQAPSAQALENAVDVTAVNEAAALSQEPFPLELQDRHRRISPSTEAKTGGGHETSQPQPAPPSESSLFDRIDSRLTEKIVVDQNMNAASREQYRRLAAVLHDAHNTQGLKVIMVASAVASEGKTLTASNLALTFSESYHKRVLLIDADLRRPSLHSVFRLDTTLGLGDGLLSAGDSKMLVRQVSPRLAVLPAGRPSSDPMAGLTSDRMRKLIDEARQSFDWVILDTPPIMLLPDAHLLASMVDGAIMVVRANATPFELIKRAVEAIGRQRVIGMVLNRADVGKTAYQYQYYGYGTAREKNQGIS